MSGWITALDDTEQDDGGWNLEGSGLCSATLFSNALQVWSSAQDRKTTVGEAALAFNVTPAVIRQAVDSHYWLFLSGEGDAAMIEHEGE